MKRIAQEMLTLRMPIAEQKNNPLHGKTLAQILTQLQEHYGWAELGYLLRFNCFIKDPSINSSLKFLRKEEWARKQVEQLFIDTFCK
jgi:uncharacterized protein (DUF2132 family)